MSNSVAVLLVVLALGSTGHKPCGDEVVLLAGACLLAAIMDALNWTRKT